MYIHPIFLLDIAIGLNIKIKLSAKGKHSIAAQLGRAMICILRSKALYLSCG
jgi:hypothetical protein